MTEHKVDPGGAAVVDDKMMESTAKADGEPALGDLNEKSLEPRLDNPPITTPQPEAEAEGYNNHHHYIFPRLKKQLPPLTPRRKLAISIALCVSMILCGWNDGSTGPLFPTLQEYYHINYLVMSLIYMTLFAGAMIGALLNMWLTDRIGFGLVTPFGALMNAVCFALAGTGAPFGVFLVAFLFNGFGLSIQDAQVNNLATRLPNPAVLMSFVQASFSGGATIAPFIATAFAQHIPRRSYLYFLVAMGVALLTMLIMLVAFKGMTEEQIVGQADKDKETATTASDLEATAVAEKTPQQPSSGTTHNRTSTDEVLPEDVIPADATGGVIGEAVQLEAHSSGKKLLRILKRPAIYALMAWSFLYVGLEVGTSSWLTTFLIRERGASAAAGYAVTGFWGAMTVGRILLIPVTHRLGSQTAIYAYALIALAMEFIIWFVDSVPGNAVCFAIIGFFLGPIYPVALMVISETWDDELRGGVMGLMGSIGGAGAALGPFIMGGISDRYGIWAIQPIAVAMIGGFTGLWALTPKPKRVKKEKKEKKKKGAEEAAAEVEMEPVSRAA